MPELPEVETIRAGLGEHLVGLRIEDVEIVESRLRRPVDRERLGALVGRRFVAARRRGKYLLLDLDDGDVLLVHLGMSGRLVLTGSSALREPHEHLRFPLEGSRCLVYRDPRRFGIVCVGREASFVELARLGPDPLAADFDRSAVSRALRRTRRMVRVALLDQRLVAGVGNIYANEILARARVRPARRGHRLRLVEADAISRAIPEILARAVRLRGTSFSDYVDWAGRKGGFQDRLVVFDREGEPCRRCATPIHRLVHGNRSSFFCPRCQH